MSARLACVVPFCRRTFKNDKAGTPWPEESEILCGKHYRLADKRLRERLRKIRRLKKKLLRLKARKHNVSAKAVRMDWATWDSIKRQAIERAAGIA